MKLAAKWYPGPDHITYGDEDLDKAFRDNPDRILLPSISAMSILLRRTRFKLTHKGMVRLHDIIQCLNLSKYRYRYDRKCGCSCGCSPGFRIYDPYIPHSTPSTKGIPQFYH